MTQEK